MQKYYQTGQVGLIVLLVGAVLMTLGLGVASQSVLETKTARQEADSSQTFNAAEQGIEAALKDLSNGSITGSIPVTYTSTPVTARYETDISPGDSAELVLNDNVKNLVFNWVAGDCASNPAALVIMLIYGTNGEHLQRYAVDKCTRSNAFTIINLPFTLDSAVLDSFTAKKLVRIKSVYKPATVTVDVTGNNIPTQAYDIASTATKTDSNETRKVEVTRGNPAVPGIFDYALFSGGGIN